MRELVTAQERTISAYEEMNRAWHAWEVSERGRVQAVQVGAMVFAMLGESKARVAALERRIDAIGSAPVETAVDELNLLRQDLQRAKHQEMALQERLARAEHERDRAQRVADFAARRAHDLEVELVRISGSIGTSTDSNRTEFAESRIERVSRSTKQLDDVELALEKIDFVLDRGHEEIQLAADGLGWTKPVLFGLIGGERIEAESNEISGQTAPGRPTTENDSARRVLALAQQVADQAIAEARTEANKIVAQAQKEVDDLLRRQQDLNAESSKVQDVIEPLESPEAPDGLRPTSDL
ncbi:hypothetical protein [Streptomyces sp. NPDC007883]|uniref:hypothetical protein n=1 Tax=Streptomyces sp. NPDC007883 TaxID=3155116 RepID=UPI0033C26011